VVTKQLEVLPLKDSGHWMTQRRHRTWSHKAAILISFLVHKSISTDIGNAVQCLLGAVQLWLVARVTQTAVTLST